MNGIGRPREFRFLFHFLPGITLALLLMSTGCSSSDEEVDSNSDTPSTPSEPSDTTPDEEVNSEAGVTPSESITAAPEMPGDRPDSKPAEPDKPKTSAVEENASESGSFSGRIVLTGDAPRLDPLTRADDENLKDKEVCGVADIPDESMLIGENKGIANVFVYLRRAPKGFESQVPEQPVVLDQKACIFTPHVALIQTSQKVLVKSSDAIQHNVHTFPARNQGTNLLINPNDRKGVELEYIKPESDPVQVKCDIHAWMVSYHLVLDHPFMAVTNQKGEFQIDGLPAGDYQFRIWHERAGVLEKGYKTSITGSDAPIELAYAADAFQK